SCQTFPRPVGLVIGLELTAHSFILCPAWLALADLPPADRITEMRKPDIRARLIAEHTAQPVTILTRMSALFDQMYAFGESPNYEPAVADSIANIAARRGVSPV